MKPCFKKVHVAEYVSNNKYKKGEAIIINTNNIQWYHNYQSKGYGDCDNIVTKLIFLNGNELFIFETEDEFNNIMKSRSNL